MQTFEVMSNNLFLDWTKKHRGQQVSWIVFYLFKAPLNHKDDNLHFGFQEYQQIHSTHLFANILFSHLIQPDSLAHPVI